MMFQRYAGEQEDINETTQLKSMIVVTTKISVIGMIKLNAKTNSQKSYKCKHDILLEKHLYNRYFVSGTLPNVIGKYSVTSS